MNTTINSDEDKETPEAAQPKAKRTPAKKIKHAKKAGRAKKASKPKADRTNKKAEVIALLKRAKGATLRVR